MNKKPKDRHLDVPAEANRDKHINFVADERSETDPSQDGSAGQLAPSELNKKAEKKKRSQGNINNEQ